LGEQLVPARAVAQQEALHGSTAPQQLEDAMGTGHHQWTLGCSARPHWLEVRSDPVPGSKRSSAASPMGKILHRYIFREVVTPFVLGLGIFPFVLLIARLLKLIEMVVNRGLPATQILELLGYLMPAFLEVTVPMAMLLAILIAFGRLSADSEMVAMR